MARHNGKFCKLTKAERLKSLTKAREARWKENQSSQPSCSAPISDIPFPYVDHTYNQLDIQPVVSQQEEVKSEDVDELGWRCGRRIVELGVLADGLKACQLCGHPLHLTDCVGEKKFGLAHILMVKCQYVECGLVNDVPTGSRHKTTNCASAWDVNTKLAAGMINGGFGESHVNGFLSSLNIPTITQSTLKSREREITPHLHKMAEDSCNKHLREEISMSDGNLTAGFDGAWQKRGTGRAYNSLTGHASLIGNKTKKCIGISVMGKRCRICEHAEKKGVPPRNHNCCRNWSGSAKSMEPAMACEMLQGIKDQGNRVQTLVMDNDSTTIARVKATVDPAITKKSDSNHTRKGFTGSLVELGNTYKVLKNNRVRSHIERCFMYCVKQNSGNSTKLADDLNKIVPHLYGEHSECGTWCKSDKTNYKPKNLPYGKPLSDQSLRVALESLMNKYTQKADELVDLGSTQNNENFNHMVASKAPKRF